MNITPTKHPHKAPRTRRELLSHIWSFGIDCDVFKEGPYYAIRMGRTISATHIRCINDFSFSAWLNKIQSVAKTGALA